MKTAIKITHRYRSINNCLINYSQIHENHTNLSNKFNRNKKTKKKSTKKLIRKDLQEIKYSIIKTRIVEN